MIVGDITRFTNKGMGLAMRVLAAGLAALLALTFLNLTVLPGTALAEEADGVDAATEHLVLPAPEEPEAGSNVFVYLHLKWAGSGYGEGGRVGGQPGGLVHGRRHCIGRHCETE